MEEPVLSPELPWEKAAVMCPHVLWDERERQYRMWYSGGEQYEPDAIGYATSPDGIRWTKWPANPIFTSDPACGWEKHKVTGCQAIQKDDWHIMFYIGFRDVDQTPSLQIPEPPLCLRLGQGREKQIPSRSFKAQSRDTVVEVKNPTVFVAPPSDTRYTASDPSLSRGPRQIPS